MGEGEKETVSYQKGFDVNPEGEIVETDKDVTLGKRRGKEKTRRRRSTLRLIGYPGDYLPGIKERVKPKGLEKLRRAIAKGLGKDITHQPELEGLVGRESETSHPSKKKEG